MTYVVICSVLVRDNITTKITGLVLRNLVNDHIVFYNSTNKLLFSGDTLFSLGCGRVFEGTYEQMFKSLQNLNDLPNETHVYCGHEYTYQNYKFLRSIFSNYNELRQYKNKID